MKLTTLAVQPLADIIGVSGIEYIPPFLYMVRDDAPYILQTTLDLTQYQQLPLVDTSDPQALLPLAKAVKPDYEGFSQVLWQNKPYLLVFGSGSKALRKQALLYDVTNACFEVVADNQDFDYLEHREKFTHDAELNIEAVACTNVHTYIFQRGNINAHNGVMVMDTHTLLTTNSIKKAKQHTFAITSPSIDGFNSGVSGACWIPDTSLFVLTASVEKTSNSYDDGEVLGSFVGVLDASQANSSPQVQWLRLQDVSSNPYITKVESVALINSDQQSHTLLLVTDMDGGTSELITVNLQLG